jgi:hypothetical protein
MIEVQATGQKSAALGAAPIIEELGRTAGDVRGQGRQRETHDHDID